MKDAIHDLRLAARRDPFNGALQNALADTLEDRGFEREATWHRHNKFFPVPRGLFWMSQDGVNARVQVEIEKDFELSAYAVTQGQWQSLLGSNPSYFARVGGGADKVQWQCLLGGNPSYFARAGGGADKVRSVADGDLQDFPVEQVSCADVEKFIKALNQREQERGWVYRLPSEAEWEYACRGAATSKEACSFDFYLNKHSNDLMSHQANFNGNHPAGGAAEGPYLERTTKVGSHPPNGLGLFDMHGNVLEWTADNYDASGSDRVMRGGCDLYDGLYCRAADRRWIAPSEWWNYVGFRLARVPSGG